MAAEKLFLQCVCHNFSKT